jgi:hypothetical protein
VNPLCRDLTVADDPVAFARLAGFDPHPYQVAVLRSVSKRLILNWSRQAGKSTVTSYLPIHRAQYRPGSLTLLLAPGERQAELLLDKVYEALDAIGRDAIRTEVENVLELILENGSTIVALPGKDGTIRGYSGVDLLVIDEASRVSDSLYNAVRPMLAASNGSLVLLSTPFGKRGFFHDIFTGDSPNWERHEVPVTSVPHIDPAFVEEERRELPEQWFAQEYLCKFIETTDTVFTLDQIQRAMNDPAVTPLFGQSLTGPLGDPAVTPLAF